MRRKKILLVDDNADIRRLTKFLLEKAGYAVLTAADGTEGIDVYQKHQSSIDLLLTDVKMPNMNGLDLADHVLEIEPHLPVLFMSGDHNSAKRAFACVTKPFLPQELVTGVRQALDVSEKRRQKGEKDSIHSSRPMDALKVARKW